ncbi:uncharacterized protein LACBIDRAFT_333266 [Laccaria bicolor S238N-H82]|uniref:Predicted protein n=1 Tax=Laccaria bicolor (strain S238N-H82 / ATCC MYA-4686) TaxID=486041 RepID=B0DVF3_LACBS|nr:uncharacterized protein LACBIDRAFT_333266 [Laccaria bicolor S238N-H82]EDR01372.1 predicted protein [Laccaria bicolor S238N-H82]|eukprot:XP_001887917.1 predicted protein [Laccaria bicolor S238N-H82]
MLPKRVFEWSPPNERPPHDEWSPPNEWSPPDKRPPPSLTNGLLLPSTNGLLPPLTNGLLSRRMASSPNKRLPRQMVFPLPSTNDLPPSMDGLLPPLTNGPFPPPLALKTVKWAIQEVLTTNPHLAQMWPCTLKEVLERKRSHHPTRHCASPLIEIMDLD